MTKIICSNVLFQKSYEKYSSVPTIPDDERMKRFWNFIESTNPDIVAIQEASLEWFSQKNINKNYAYIGHNDEKYDGNAFIYNINTITPFKQHIFHSWFFTDRNDKRLLAQCFENKITNKKYHIVNCHIPFIENNENIIKDIHERLQMIVNMSQFRDYSQTELVVCGDFNMGKEHNLIIDDFMKRLNLVNVVFDNTCALSTKKYDIFDRMYIKVKNNVDFDDDEIGCFSPMRGTVEKALIYPIDETELLKHHYFDNEGTNIGSFYSDHSAIFYLV